VFAVPKSIANSRPARDPNLTTDPKPSDALPWGPGLSPVVHRRSGRRSAELEPVPHVPTAFGEDAFGRRAEKAARFFGTPQYILGQSLVVVAWIAVNAVAVSLRWDPYPFILLNLAFSTQAAYAAPLILLAQTRQVERDKVALDQLENHREEVMHHMQTREAAIKKETDELRAFLATNTDLTREDKELTEKVAALTREIHARVQAGR
jgi:uncharacterized membrane protein